MKIYDTTSLDGEEWRDIPGYEGYYMVSNMGRVKSLIRLVKKGYGYRKIRERIMVGSPDDFGYSLLSLSKEGKHCRIRVHRLVGVVFMGIDKSNIDICVLHKDDDPSNNRLDNLFLGTRTDNARDREMKGRGKWVSGKDSYFFGRKGKDHHSSKPVKQYTISGDFIREWESATIVQNELGIWRANIQKCCRGGCANAGGYKWEYII